MAELEALADRVRTADIRPDATGRPTSEPGPHPPAGPQGMD